MEKQVLDSVESQEPSALNLANALTVLRLVLVPVFVVAMMLQTLTASWIALVVFCVAAATDQFDGKIARSRGQVTNFGKIADPIADKALVLSAFVLLSVYGPLPWWFTIIVLIRELGVTILRFSLLSKRVIAASWSGKVKTVAQLVLILLLLVPWEYFLTGFLFLFMGWLSWFVLWCALFLTVWSGAEIVIAGFSSAEVGSTQIKGEGEGAAPAVRPNQTGVSSGRGRHRTRGARHVANRTGATGVPVPATPRAGISTQTVTAETTAEASNQVSADERDMIALRLRAKMDHLLQEGNKTENSGVEE